MLARTIPFAPADDAAVFAALPPAPGVFILRAHDDAAEPYVSKSSNLRRKVSRLLAPPESQSKRLNLRAQCRSIEWQPTASAFENSLLLYRTLRTLFPDSYARRLRLRTPPLIRIHWENAYPRAYVTTRLGTLDKRSVYFGPFRSHAVAEHFLSDALDLFKSRRCTFELDPDPAFPGCVYSEMKMCLAPCFKGCTDADYMAEVQRAQRFLESRGSSLINDWEAHRDQASAALAFEEAAAVHAKLEKAKAAARQMDELVHRLDQFRALIVQPSLEANSVAIFLFGTGGFKGPVNLALKNREALRNEDVAAAIDAVPAPERVSVATFAENLALLQRWYYRGSRVGEIFFPNEDGEWALRRVANAAERIVPPKATSVQSE